MIATHSQPETLEAQPPRQPASTNRTGRASLSASSRTDWRPELGSQGMLRHSPSDALFIALALLHGSVLLLAPSILLIGLGLWWNSNTVAHNFIHRPFFRQRVWNLLFSVGLSLLLGLPQRLWRDRHLAHHAGVPWRLRLSRQLLGESLLVGTMWGLLLVYAPSFFIQVYLPGYLLGLTLCSLQGHYEHARGTVSHYGRLYNWLFFNDGYHVEHHARPAEHWRHLPRQARQDTRPSRWPAVFRWLEWFSLDSLERIILRSPPLKRLVLHCHERAFRKLLRELPEIHHVGIVGGGIFPRTALVLQRLLPNARLTIIDASLANIQTAQAFFKDEVEFRHAHYDGSPVPNMDLIVIPLAFMGDRRRIYLHPSAPAILVHDWIWRRHKTSAIVSWPLLKRLNLVREGAL